RGVLLMTAPGSERARGTEVPSSVGRLRFWEHEPMGAPAACLARPRADLAAQFYSLRSGPQIESPARPWCFQCCGKRLPAARAWRKETESGRRLGRCRLPVRGL